MGRKKAAKKTKELGKEMVGEAYEKLFAAISMAFHPNDFVEHNVRITQSSGLKRRIDVSINGEETIVECKDKGKPVEPATMDGFIRLCQTTKKKGIFVSKSGFTAGSLLNAEEAGIKTYTLEQITDEDFLSNFQMPKVSVLRFNTDLINCGFEIEKAKCDNIPLTFPADAPPVFLCDDGKERTFQEFTTLMYDRFKVDAQFEIFRPLLEKIFPGKKLELLNKKTRLTLKINIPQGLLLLKNGEERIQVASFTLFIDYWLTLEHQNKEVFIQRDEKNKVISKAIKADMFYNDKPYSMTYVDTGNPGEINVTMVPKFRDSKILKVEKLGQLGEPKKVIEIISESKNKTNGI